MLMTDIRERLLQNARIYESNMHPRWFAKDSTVNDGWYESAHMHALTMVQGGAVKSPIVGSGGENGRCEIFVEYWPVEILIGDFQRQEQLITEPRLWSNNRYGTYGVGYLLVTNRRLILASLKGLAGKYSSFRTTISSFLIGALAKDVSRMR